MIMKILQYIILRVCAHKYFSNSFKHDRAITCRDTIRVMDHSEGIDTLVNTSTDSKHQVRGIHAVNKVRCNTLLLLAAINLSRRFHQVRTKECTFLNILRFTRGSIKDLDRSRKDRLKTLKFHLIVLLLNREPCWSYPSGRQVLTFDIFVFCKKS